MKGRAVLGSFVGLLLVALVAGAYLLTAAPAVPPPDPLVQRTPEPSLSAPIGATDSRDAVPTRTATAQAGTSGRTPTAVSGATVRSNTYQFPEKVLKTLETIRQTGQPPRGYVGGSHFGNFEGLLPANGDYREYDVDPKRPGVSRNAERIVIDRKTGRAWYTADHYRSFIPIP